MEAAFLVLHRHDAAVASAHAAAHDPFDRHFTWTFVLHRDPSGRGQHAFRSAGVDDHLTLGIESRQPAFEWRRDAAPFAKTSPIAP